MRIDYQIVDVLDWSSPNIQADKSFKLSLLLNWGLKAQLYVLACQSTSTQQSSLLQEYRRETNKFSNSVDLVGFSYL